MNDKLDLVIDKINDLKEHQNVKINNLHENIEEFKNRLKAHQMKEEMDLVDIKKDLKYHIKRTDELQNNTNILTQLHIDNQKRIDQNEDEIKINSTKVIALEVPKNARKYLVVAFKGLGIVAVGILSILKLIDYIK